MLNINATNPAANGPTHSQYQWQAGTVHAERYNVRKSKWTQLDSHALSSLATLFIHSLPQFLSRNYRGWVLLVLCNSLLDFLALTTRETEILVRGSDVVPKHFDNVKLFREW